MFDATPGHHQLHHHLHRPDDLRREAEARRLAGRTRLLRRPRRRVRST